MSRKRKSQLDLIPKKEVKLNVSYRTFFYQCVTEKLVKAYQEEEIYLFFRGLGLADKEPEYRYRDALAKY